MLPLELQVEIFSHCLPPFAHFDIDEAPLLIARISKAWRDLVYNTPKLWSTFEIEITGSGPGISVSLHNLSITRTIRLWLKRSKAAPLNVRVIHVPVGRIPDHRSAQILALLVPEARRWKHVEFILPSSSISSIQDSLPDGFPELRSLTLQMKGFWGSDPSLDLFSMHIPWQQLTSLSLQLEHGNLLNLDQCLDILSHANRLAEFTASVNCVFDSDRRDARSEGLSLPTLQTLHLIIQGSGDVRGVPASDRPEGCLVKFLKLLSLSAIYTLHIGWFAHSDEANLSWSTNHSDFLSFLHGVSPTIRSLSFAYLPVTETELIDCLSRVPKLIHLDLRFSLSDFEHDPITDNLWTASILPSSTYDLDDTRPTEGSGHQMTMAPTSIAIPATPLLPVLESWNMHCHGKRYSHTSLLSMLDSRLNIRHGTELPTRLKSFHLLSMNSVPQAVQKCIQTWSNEGVDILIDSLIIR